MEGSRHGQYEADQAARRNVKKAQQAAAGQKTLAHLPKKTRTPSQAGCAVAQRQRTGSSDPKTRAELYELAKQRDLPGRSKMGRDELARQLARNDTADCGCVAAGTCPGGGV